MVLPGNDDIDQMINEVAPKDSEIEDSSKGNEVVETKPVKVQEESSDGEKEGDNRAKWEAIENMQAIETSTTETLIDVTKQELQGSMEIKKNKRKIISQLVAVLFYQQCMRVMRVFFQVPCKNDKHCNHVSK